MNTLRTYYNQMLAETANLIKESENHESKLKSEILELEKQLQSLKDQLGKTQDEMDYRERQLGNLDQKQIELGPEYLKVLIPPTWDDSDVEGPANIGVLRKVTQIFGGYRLALTYLIGNGWYEVVIDHRNAYKFTHLIPLLQEAQAPTINMAYKADLARCISYLQSFVNEST